MLYDVSDSLEVISDAGIITLTLARPDQRNAVGPDLHKDLSTIWAQIRRDPSARVVIITGAGRAFSAGGDLEMMLDLHESHEARERTMEELSAMVHDMIQFPLPIIAAVNGPAVGLGCSLAVLCDIVLLAERAYLADPHVAVGLVAGDGGAAFWPLLSSPARFRELLFTGDRISPDEAVAMGLASRTVNGSVLDEAVRVAQRLAALPQQALRDTKRTVNLHLARALDGAFQTGMAAERDSLQSADHIQLVRGMVRRADDGPEASV